MSSSNPNDFLNGMKTLKNSNAEHSDVSISLFISKLTENLKNQLFIFKKQAPLLKPLFFNKFLIIW